MYNIQSKINIPISIEEAWNFFSQPKNLSKITPKEMGFNITSKNLAEEMYPGMIITYKVSPLLGIKLDWMTEITQVNKHKYFVDEQRVGPYKIWHHQHHFKSINGGVEVTDIIDYVVPLGILGKIAHPIIVKPQLKKIFQFREEKIVELFGKL